MSHNNNSVDADDDDKKDKTTLSHPSWHNAVAGGVAGAGSRMATAPLDLIRIRRQLTPATLYPSESLWQSWVNIVQNEGGISALFRGNLAAVYLWIGYAAVQFSVYGRTKEQVQSVLSSTASAFVSGAVAGTFATLATYPFDVCRTTFAARGIVPQVQSLPFGSMAEPHFGPPVNLPPKTLRQFVVQLYQQKGIRGFYAGVNPAVVQIIPYMGLNFGIYDTLTRGDKSVGLSAYAGSIAGAMSKLLIYPVDTVKRRLQHQAFYSGDIVSPYKGMMDCVTRIAREEGFCSFYRGVVPSVLKTTIASSLSFSLFRFSKNVLERTQPD
ncbi:solute carrier family 25 (mitochondrial thiamine pyrophosphate transporter), member 19 [Fistulifera solaris]|uniref:Solute carrier family 25 (Mitochondrial thiamine pyrophosphate transporter), member 19 n=1 Tax=Fistulifera solaris TaxID=1519565 RepID=A0A1Z5JUB1_FISSO|nr:solute carrier family 25 (mitochondrial thiamine pyrophosphate transporter), member 19 [Fistulifera solaris]|eukprot:GAX17456.1 solute carrier family 25 (mitochondrial thiamine pyrophosphate transporter), member 19 [Fistulifera solaris]